MADEEPARATPAERLRKTLQFDDSLYRRFTAIHEAGHAIVALATAEASVSECVIAATEITPGAGPADAYTDVSWNSPSAHLTLLYGGAIAQQRWLREQHLWTPERDSAVATLSNHDYAALDATGATPEQFGQARSAALALRDRHWPAIIAVGAVLDQNGRVSGEELNALLQASAVTRAAPSPPPPAPGAPSLSYFMDRAKQIAAESRQRASASPLPQGAAPLPHAQAESLNSQQCNPRHIK
ncbi:hypothetical protein [Streptomyces sp. NPDC058861]|uniref:hypothetical protein n=1 Tax=Streptomyces sp. NPDC058861 TaxID=3346653 RepID=UPI0036A5E048